jgi:hypothetical protein
MVTLSDYCLTLYGQSLQLRVFHGENKLYFDEIMMMMSAFNHISGVLVRVLPSSPVDRGFELRSSQTKDCKIGIRCFASPLSRKSRLVGSESG